MIAHLALRPQPALLLPFVCALALGGCPPPEEPPPEEAVPDRTEVVPDPSDDTVIIIPPGTDPDPDDPDPPPEPEREVEPVPPHREAEGVVGVSGTGALPVAVLRTEAGASMGLTGPLASELRRLSGARVRVEGRPSGTAVGPGIDVRHYEILEIEGRRPRVGMLKRSEPDVWTLVPDEGAHLALEGFPGQDLAEGTKVWVIGRELSDDRVQVESYGILARPNPS